MADDDETPPDMVPTIVVELMQQSSRELAWTTNTLMDNYRRQIQTAEATIEAMRASMDALFSGKWMPTSDAIARAMWPSDELIDHYRKADPT